MNSKAVFPNKKTLKKIEYFKIYLKNILNEPLSSAFFIHLLYYFSIQHVLQFDGHFPLQHFNRTHSTQSLINTIQQNEMRKYIKKKTNFCYIILYNFCSLNFVMS